MFNIFICEDDLKQLSQMEQWVQEIITFHDLPMKISLATSNPYEIIEKQQENSKNIYFFDIDLGEKITGIEAASEIRKNDQNAKIIFVTTYDELMPLIFKYRIEALDYIVKNSGISVKPQVSNVLIDINRTDIGKAVNGSDKKLILHGKINSRVIDEEDIMFLETMSAHKVSIHLKKSQLDVSRTLKEFEKELPNFVRVHKSWLVNPNAIKSIDKKERKIEFQNGENCFGQRDKVRKLAKSLAFN